MILLFTNGTRGFRRIRLNGPVFFISRTFYINLHEGGLRPSVPVLRLLFTLVFGISPQTHIKNGVCTLRNPCPVDLFSICWGRSLFSTVVLLLKQPFPVVFNGSVPTFLHRKYLNMYMGNMEKSSRVVQYLLLFEVSKIPYS